MGCRMLPTSALAPTRAGEAPFGRRSIATRWVLALPLAAAGCASIIGLPDVPGVEETGSPVADGGPGCVGVNCNGGLTDSAQAVAESSDDSGGGFAEVTLADAAIDALAPGAGDDSISDSAIDTATSSQPIGDSGSDMGASPIDASTVPEAAADGRVNDAPNGHEDASDAAGGSLDVGLVALYHFDETSGTTAADSSGNANTATMEGGATFSAGVRGNAATLNGTDQYVMLPVGIVSALTNFSISAWVYEITGAVEFGDRVFDFGTGETVNMFVTTDANVLRYAVTKGGHAAEEDLLTTGILPLLSWQHIAVTQVGEMATLYLNGSVVSQNAATTLHPSSLGVTTQNWIGRSQYANDHYLEGEVDEFRIYNRALSAAEVMDLYVEKR